MSMMHATYRSKIAAMLAVLTTQIIEQCRLHVAFMGTLLMFTAAGALKHMPYYGGVSHAAISSKLAYQL